MRFRQRHFGLWVIDNLSHYLQNVYNRFMEKIISGSIRNEKSNSKILLLHYCMSNIYMNKEQQSQGCFSALSTFLFNTLSLTLSWLYFYYQLKINWKIQILTFKASHRQTPPYIADFIQLHPPTCSLRSSGQRLLVFFCIVSHYIVGHGDEIISVIPFTYQWS